MASTAGITAGVDARRGGGGRARMVWFSHRIAMSATASRAKATASVAKAKRTLSERRATRATTRRRGGADSRWTGPRWRTKSTGG